VGQYYKAINITKKQGIEPWDYKTGAKLMEHSWMKDDFVKTVEGLLVEGGKWFGNRIVWAGDYADEEPNEQNNLYHLLDKRKKLQPKTSGEYYRYIINIDDWEYIDKQKVPNDDGWMIHPLPLMTCEGNGRGGGDFRNDDPNGLIGRWARKRIMVQKKKPKNMKEIIFDLVE
jgi:hypothetical protein